jgi:ribonuclease P protein component
MCGQVIAELPADADIVIRALPGAATTDSTELLRQLRGALRKLDIVGPSATVAGVG